MAPLQFWIRGDLAADQRARLTEIGARAIPMAASMNGPDGPLRPAAWTMIETSPGEPDTERARVAAVLGAEPDELSGPYAFH